MKFKLFISLIPTLIVLSSCNPFGFNGEDDPINDCDDCEPVDNNPVDPMEITEPYEKFNAQDLIKWDNSQSNLRSGTKTLDFYNLNDLHGAVENIAADGEPGISKLSYYIKEKKKLNQNGFVFTSTGDMWQGSADSNITRGRLVTEWMNHLECSAMTLGNHEFDWTINTIVKNDNFANFDFLASNIIDTNTNKEVDWVKPFTTLTKNGVNIGLIGAIGEGITSSILSSNVKGLKFDKIDSYVTKWSNYLKQNGADVVLLLLHSPIEEAADLVSNKVVDAVFGGHSHQLERSYTNGIYSIQSLCNGEYLGHISLSYNFSTSSVFSLTGESIDLRNEYIPNDSATDEIYNKYHEEIDKVKNEVVGYTPRTISRTDALSYLLSYMNKYYVEVLKETDYPLTRVTHNNARSDIPAGNITYGAIYKAFPFDNDLVLIKKKGSKFSYDDYGTHLYINGSTLNPNQYYYDLTISYISDYAHTDDDYLIVKRYPGIYVRDIFKKYIGNDYPKK